MDYPSLSLSKEAIEEALADKDRELKRCDKCDYTTKGAVMYQHMNIKHSGKSFKCDDCDFRHFYKCKVKSHQKQVHLNQKRKSKY